MDDLDKQMFQLLSNVFKASNRDKTGGSSDMVGTILEMLDQELDQATLNEINAEDNEDEMLEAMRAAKKKKREAENKEGEAAVSPEAQADQDTPDGPETKNPILVKPVDNRSLKINDEPPHNDNVEKSLTQQ